MFFLIFLFLEVDGAVTPPCAKKHNNKQSDREGWESDGGGGAGAETKEGKTPSKLPGTTRRAVEKNHAAHFGNTEATMRRWKGRCRCNKKINK